MINKFEGYYSYLSNFFNVAVEFDGLCYDNSEAAFQAQKVRNKEDRKRFVGLNPSQAKALGRRVKLRGDWEDVKDRVMYEICYAKFTQNKELLEKLLETRGEYLEEGNTWNDTYWGTCDGVGKNKLGKILMYLRDELIFVDQFGVTPIGMKNQIVNWISGMFHVNGKDCNAVIGISGGKDSAVAAALCVEALGEDRVIGVLLPDGEQSDIGDADKLVSYLGIRSYEVNIGNTVNNAVVDIEKDVGSISEQAEINLPARIRMAMLYAVSQSLNGRVINTSNLSERWIGYTTLFGDSVGDFSPLSNLTSDEVIAVGKECGLPDELLYKEPADGLCGKTDEKVFGFSYAMLNQYIRTGICRNTLVQDKIDHMHERNKFKMSTDAQVFMPLPSYTYERI